MQTWPDNSASNHSFAWTIRIYYEDTDAGGIVFYANYLKFFERARTEWLRARGVDQRRLAAETGTLFVVRGSSIDYLQPARLDDELRIDSRVERLGRASVDFRQIAYLDAAIIATSTIRVACIDSTSFRPTALPPVVVAALRAAPGEPVAKAAPAPLDLSGEPRAACQPDAVLARYPVKLSR